MRRGLALALAILLLPAPALAQRIWQDAENTNGYVTVTAPSVGTACFLYQTAAFDIQCYTTIPSDVITVPNGVLEGVAGAITGYTAVSGEVQVGAVSGGGLRQFTSLTFDGTHLGLGTPSSGAQTALSGSVSSSLSQLTLAPTGGTAVGNIFNLIPKGAGSFGITSAVFLYNTDAIADATNYERLLIEGHGTLGYLFLSGAAGTGAARPIAFDATGSTSTQLVLGTSGSTTFGVGDILMSKTGAQAVTKSGGLMTVGTTDLNSLNLETNGTTAIAIDTAQGVTLSSQAGHGTVCAQFDNTGKLGNTGATCGGGAGGGITQLTGDVAAGPGSGSQTATLLNVPNDTPHAGDYLATAIAAPATPSAGKARVYVDSTSKNLAVINDAGTVNHAAQSIGALSAGLALAGLSDNGAWTVHTFQVPLTACTDYVSIACVTGATDLGGSNATPTVIGIESDATMRGDLLATNVVAPATPAAGKSRIYVDSTGQTLASKNDAGIVAHTMQDYTCAANKFATAGNNFGSTTCTQPTFSNLSGSATCAQLPALAGDVTSSAGSCTTVVANLPDGVTQAGKIVATEITAPANPAANHLACWADFATENWMCKKSLGTINHGTQDYTCATHQFANHEGNSGATSCAQVDFSDLSGSSACAQLPALTGGVTSSAGSCATTVASVPCAALPALTGDVTSSAGACGTALATVATAGTYGSSVNVIRSVTIDAKGRTTSITTSNKTQSISFSWAMNQSGLSMGQDRSTLYFPGMASAPLATETAVAGTSVTSTMALNWGSGFSPPTFPAGDTTYNAVSLSIDVPIAASSGSGSSATVTFTLYEVVTDPSVAGNYTPLCHADLSVPTGAISSFRTLGCTAGATASQASLILVVSRTDVTGSRTVTNLQFQATAQLWATP